MNLGAQISKFDLIQMRKSSLDNNTMTSSPNEAVIAQSPLPPPPQARLSDVYEQHEHEHEPLIKSKINSAYPNDNDVLPGPSSAQANDLNSPSSSKSDNNIQAPYSNNNSITGSQRVKFYSDYNIKRETPLNAQPPGETAGATRRPDDVQHIQRFDVFHVDTPVQSKLPPPGKDDKYFINENGSILDLDSTKPKKPLSRETSGRKTTFFKNQVLDFGMN